MRIGFSGAQGVGKTTMLEMIKKRDDLKGYLFFDNFVKTTQSKYDLKVNYESNALTQRILMMEMVSYTLTEHCIVLDRSPLDVYVYSLNLYKKGMIDSGNMSFIRNLYLESIDFFDIIFYMKPEFDLVDNGYRSMDNDFRNEIADLFEEVVNERIINIYHLTGSVEQRTSTMNKAVDNFYNFNPLEGI